MLAASEPVAYRLVPKASASKKRLKNTALVVCFKRLSLYVRLILPLDVFSYFTNYTFLILTSNIPKNIERHSNYSL